MDGQGAIAIQAGKDYAKLTGAPMYHLATLVRFGRFDEVLDIDERPKDDPIQEGFWDFAHGYARLRLEGADFARGYANRLWDLTTAGARFRGHETCNLLGVLAYILEGEIQREEGDLEAAITSFEWAVGLDDDLRYDEPEPLPFAARHWLGAALLEADRNADAERVYRDELADHPHNGWSLYGLLEALEAQGKEDPAVEADFEKSWARSDTWIRGSRF
jgi:tetratricopeptide (TPR) repeat protein